ncbi:hypothetical protein PG987_003109 [Apiospora arundinis]|uniref:Uncharacterized protein n=1 Tax=Apiospora arundinis TaxID=335852 RepID=A0ABR2HZW5_9PEZI
MIQFSLQYYYQQSIGLFASNAPIMPSIEVLPLVEASDLSGEEPGGDDEADKESNSDQTPAGNLQKIPHTKSRRQLATRARLTARELLVDWAKAKGINRPVLRATSCRLKAGDSFWTAPESLVLYCPLLKEDHVYYRQGKPTNNAVLQWLPVTWEEGTVVVVRDGISIVPFGRDIDLVFIRVEDEM